MTTKFPGIEDRRASMIAQYGTGPAPADADGLELAIGEGNKTCNRPPAFGPRGAGAKAKASK